MAEVRLELPNGLGLSDEDLKQLIDHWIVPQLVRIFVAEQQINAGIEVCSEKKPSCSETPSSRTSINPGKEILRRA
jgi:hypothetical protein